MTRTVDNGTELAALARSDITVEARVVRIDTARGAPPVGMAEERRRSIRVPVDHRVRCRYGPGESGAARLCDAGRNGVRTRSGRYLRPGTLLMIEIGPRGSAELKAKVAWCRPVPDSSEFHIGLRVFHDDPGAFHALAGLMFDGLDRLGAERVRPGCGGGPGVFLKACIAPVAPACRAV